VNAHPPTPPRPAGPDGPAPAGTGHLPPDVLGDLLDRRLTPEAAARAAAHLDACAACRAERDALAQVIALGAHARSRTPVPADVWPMVAAATIHEGEVRRRLLRRMRGPLLLAALALCVVSAWLGALVGRELERRGRRGADASAPDAAGPDARTLERQMELLREREREAEQKRARLPRP